MSETCTVCGKGKGPEKCEVCGFSDNGSINRQFSIPEDAQNWIDTVVKPYRVQWEAKKREAELLAQLEEKNKKIIELEAQIEESKKNVQALTQTYMIGDRGPAGGIIFCDKGDNSDGWRYLETAPNDLGKAVWSWSINWPVGTKDGIGSGKRNTELIIAELNRKGESGSAAQLCKEYILNGYNDWFLPSKDELNLLYRNLKKNNLGGFLYDSYWSSSQDIYYDAWAQRFSDGFQYLFNYCFKNDAYLVRAVRAF